MNSVSWVFHSIGVIHSEHQIAEDTPIQPVYAPSCAGQVEVFQEYAKGLSDLEGFSHIYLLYHFHRAKPERLRVKPFLQDTERGIFSTRAPNRPNRIGISVVKLCRREGNILHVEGLDILDGTPLLDIKPYTAKFDHIKHTRNGWQDEVDDATALALGQRGYAQKGGSNEGIH
jgi:tRNA-Thr(GGU) m(6)t(6)A37 methyltransferase TsaA